MSFSISKWVCPPPETFSEPPTSGAKVEWFSVPHHCYTCTCLSCILLSVCLVMLAALFIFLFVRMFAITAFYANFSHRAFKTSRFVQFIGGFIACCSAQRGPLWWAVIIADTTVTLTRIKTCIPPNKQLIFESYSLVYD